LEAMGGEGSIGRWLRQRLASGDLRHMTPSGYERVADAFYRALLRGFGEWLEREHATAEPAAGDDVGSQEQDAGVVLDAGVDGGTDAGVEEDAGVDAGTARPRRRRRARRRR
ncbi:MAG: hypothetical protein KC586_14675, partial [Myxococcales bacterium]|nr:hypothetical protein [Myxococcales bacterium]